MMKDENTGNLPDMSKDEEQEFMAIVAEGLRGQAVAGNIEAIKTLYGFQEEYRFNRLLKNMDDDEFTD